jgi:hypothetical protein
MLTGATKPPFRLEASGGRQASGNTGLPWAVVARRSHVARLRGLRPHQHGGVFSSIAAEPRTAVRTAEVPIIVP